jgi:hypothetical protein
LRLARSSIDYEHSAYAQAYGAASEHDYEKG